MQNRLCQLFPVIAHIHCIFLAAVCNCSRSAARPGTHYQTIFEIRRVLLTVLVVTCKLLFSRSTSVHSTLGASRLCTIQIYMTMTLTSATFKGVCLNQLQLLTMNQAPISVTASTNSYTYN